MRTLTTSTSQLPRVPNSTVDVPDPAVHRGGGCGGELPGERPDLLGVDPAVGGDGLRREVAGQRADVVDIRST